MERNIKKILSKINYKLVVYLHVLHFSFLSSPKAILLSRLKFAAHQKHAKSLLHVLQYKYIQFIQQVLSHISHIYILLNSFGILLSSRLHF
jgi:hypothetical protein